MSTELPLPNQERVLRELTALSEIRDPDLAGWSRPTFSEPERESREWIRKLMSSTGMDTRVDYLGNVIGVIPGKNPNAKAIVIGSHTDTVEGGGRFDGIVGVLGAIEVVRLLREANIQLEHELRVVDYYNEEPNRFGLSCVGSRALAGNLTDQHFALLDDRGMTLGEALEHDGQSPADVSKCRWSTDEVLASLELHIEQGPHLEQQRKSLGVVTSIAGIFRLKATFWGRRDHAGTMPMNLRKDAGCSAAGTVLAIEKIAATGKDTVGTVGEIQFSPEASNVVTEFASLNAEFRSPNEKWFQVARKDLEEFVGLDTARRGVKGEIEWLPPEAPTPMSDGVSNVITDSIAALGHDAVKLYSGAGHDAVQMAKLGPAGMIFIPSAGGRSHCPEEWTDLGDITLGIHALAQSVVSIDAGKP